jgi:hypothetical protein
MAGLESLFLGARDLDKLVADIELLIEEVATWTIDRNKMIDLFYNLVIYP